MKMARQLFGGDEITRAIFFAAAKDARVKSAQNMTTDPNATAPGGVLGLRLWTQPLAALVNRAGVLGVGRYFRIKARRRFGDRMSCTIVGPLPRRPNQCRSLSIPYQ